MDSCIRLIAPQIEDWSRRLEYSEGTIRAVLQHPALGYIESAFAPRCPWAPSTTADHQILVSDHGDLQRGRWVQVVSVPDEVFQPFAHLRRAAIRSSFRELVAMLGDPESQQAVHCARTYAQQLTAPGLTRDIAGVAVQPANLPTVTKYPALRGLHIDSTWRLPLHKRRQAPVRLSLNIGNEDRFLLFMLHDLESMAASMQRAGVLFEDDCEDERSPTHRIREAFMLAFPSAPVIKLRIHPGEAYIAPTENMIHDGCTLGQQSWDLMFTIQGHFKPIPA